MPYGVGSGSNQVPAPQSFSTLKTRVQRYVNMPSDTEGATVAGEEINDAIRELNTRTWYWALASQDITTVLDTQTYTLSYNFKAARNLQLVNSTAKTVAVLGYLDPKTFDLTYGTGSTASGSPSVYTVYSFVDTYLLSFDVPCDASFIASYPTARLRYHARVPILASAETAPVPSEVELFIMWKARAGMALQYDPKKYEMAERKAQMLWSALVRDNTEMHFHDWS